MKKVLLCLLISTIVLTGCASSSKNDKGETNSTSENNVTESVGNESDTANSTDAKDTIEIYDQLISEYGEKFTAEEAQYAIDNLQ